MTARDGRIGYGGLVRPKKRRQGTGTTPLGTYLLPSAFGTHAANDAWKVDYRRIRRGDYWVQDNGSAYYNRYRNKRRGGFRWWLSSSDANSSERLKDYPTQYEFAVVTKYNYGQVRHRGAGIFLHVNGSGATGGCVSAPRRFLVRLMRKLDPDRRPVIAVGR
jgi:L,D-peptidoglycan transpeptidase YkuD (ErfK/YbiS/YcfS/YnhG family)